MRSFQFCRALTLVEENVLFREFTYDIQFLTEMRGKQVIRIARDPFRKIDCLIFTGVEGDLCAGFFLSGIFNRMPTALRNKSDIPLSRQIPILQR